MQFIEGKRIARVFPRKTSASPNDSDAYFDGPPLWADYDEAHISVTWTYDIPRAEWLAKQWESACSVKIGGPAVGTKGEDFTPGMYVKHGYTITSRGCPNKCWFCSVWKRDGTTRELKIQDGFNLLDDNILACGEEHIRKVFAMLKRQKERAQFTGGLEAKILKQWHCELLADLKPAQMFFAYDTPDDYEPLVEAGRILSNYGLTKGHAARCYVLCGFPKDTEPAAEKRMRDAWKNGFFPMAMVWRDKNGKRDPLWVRFASCWAQPAVISRMLKDGTSAKQLREDDNKGPFTQNPTLHRGGTSHNETGGKADE